MRDRPHHRGSLAAGVITFGTLATLGALPGCDRAEGEPQHAPAAGAAGRAEGPLVLELFTSQGCSSCPAADRLLGKLASTGSLGDRPVAPLSFHVDYWNDLGWADPYSTASWTERQQQYARSLHDDRVYTPELVIGGAAGMNGADVGAVSLAIRSADRPALLPATATWANGEVTVSATAPADAEVWVAVWEAATTTKVTRGENSGSTLDSVRVVRKLARVATAGKQASTTVKLDPSWHTTGAVAFAQRPDRHITASALLTH